MMIDIANVPEDKVFSDYPEGTEFVLDDRPARLDKTALEKGLIKRVWPSDPKYGEALTVEEAMSKYDKPSE